jgi:translation initiation factor IF-3
MRISRKKRPDKPLIPLYKLNDRITAPEVRVIDAEGKNIGILPTREAVAMALAQEMDLVEINPKGQPPVAQILEYGHFKYQKEKELRKQKINSHVSDIKGIRISIRISEHDLAVRMAQAKKFLERGDKVKVEMILRDRENGKAPLAFQVIERFFALLDADIPVRYEQPGTRQGNKITAIIIRKS